MVFCFTMFAACCRSLNLNLAAPCCHNSPLQQSTLQKLIYIAPYIRKKEVHLRLIQDASSMWYDFSNRWGWLRCTYPPRQQPPPMTSAQPAFTTSTAGFKASRTLRRKLCSDVCRTLYTGSAKDESQIDLRHTIDYDYDDTCITAVDKGFLMGYKSLVTVDLSRLSTVTSIGGAFMAGSSLVSLDVSPLSEITEIPDGFLEGGSRGTTGGVLGVRS
jgi:hypothetical protein